MSLDLFHLFSFAGCSRSVVPKKLHINLYIYFEADLKLKIELLKVEIKYHSKENCATTFCLIDSKYLERMPVYLSCDTITMLCSSERETSFYYLIYFQATIGMLLHSIDSLRLIRMYGIVILLLIVPIPICINI